MPCCEKHCSKKKSLFAEADVESFVSLLDKAQQRIQCLPSQVFQNEVHHSHMTPLCLSIRTPMYLPKSFMVGGEEQGKGQGLGFRV